MRCGVFAACGLLAVAAAGCSSSLAKPTLQAPGPVSYQRQQAERFDPYPDDSLGPAVVGGHPRDFGQPRDPLPLRPNPSAAPLAAAPATVGPPLPVAPAAPAPVYAPPKYDSPYTTPSPFFPSTLTAPAPQR
jgi:hypothetical protein